MELATALLERPSIAASEAFIGTVESFAPWPRPSGGVWARHAADTHDNWRTGKLSPAEW